MEHVSFVLFSIHFLPFFISLLSFAFIYISSFLEFFSIHSSTLSFLQTLCIHFFII